MAKHAAIAAGASAIGVWAAVAAAAPLATEKIRGDVVVGAAQEMYASAAAAKAHAQDAPARGDPMALAVVADHGDVIEVKTIAAGDCVAGPDSPYKLTVFVPRSVLIPRADAASRKTYGDGTVVLVDRGAPVAGDAPAWRDPVLAATDVPVPSKLAYGVPANAGSAALPAPVGEALVCDPRPQSRADWLAARQQKHEDEAKRRPAPAPKPAPSKPKTEEQKREDEARSFTDMLTSDGGGDRDGDNVRHPGADLGQAYAPPCSVVDPSTAWDAPRGAPAAAPPTAGGRALPWPSGSRGEDHVYRAGSELRADVALTCGRVRMAVTLVGVRNYSGSGRLGIGGTRSLWTPKAGAVVWPDGRPAGTYDGHVDYTDDEVEVHGQLVCVAVDGIAERVCHRRGDVVH